MLICNGRMIKLQKKLHFAFFLLFCFLVLKRSFAQDYFSFSAFRRRLPRLARRRSCTKMIFSPQRKVKMTKPVQSFKVILFFVLDSSISMIFAYTMRTELYTVGLRWEEEEEEANFFAIYPHVYMCLRNNLECF